METSKLFTVNWRDALHGLIMAVGGGVFAMITESFNKGVFTLDFIAIWHYAAASASVYIFKKLFTPADPTKIVTKDGDGTVTQTKITTDQVDVVVPGK